MLRYRAIPRSVQIYAVGDGVKELEDPGTIVGVEDGAAIRLSVKVAREDISEKHNTGKVNWFIC